MIVDSTNRASDETIVSFGVRWVESEMSDDLFRWSPFGPLRHASRHLKQEFSSTDHVSNVRSLGIP